MMDKNSNLPSNEKKMISMISALWSLSSDYDIFIVNHLSLI